MKVRSQAAVPFIFATTTLFLLGAPQPALACKACCLTHCTPPPVQHCHCDQYCGASATGMINPGQAKVIMISPRKALIEVPNYVTANSEECEMALPSIDGISKINRVGMVDAVTKRPLKNFSWIPKPTPTDDLLRLLADAGIPWGGQGWQSFIGKVKGPTAEGQLYSFVLEVTLEEGTTSEDLVAALRTQGFIASGYARSDGSVDSDNLFLRAFGQGNIEIQERAKLGEWGHRDPGQN